MAPNLSICRWNLSRDSRHALSSKAQHPYENRFRIRLPARGVARGIMIVYTRNANWNYSTGRLSGRIFRGFLGSLDGSAPALTLTAPDAMRA